jgi:hypothetical protein
VGEKEKRKKKKLCAMIREDGPENERGERKNGKINVKVVYFGKTSRIECLMKQENRT